MRWEPMAADKVTQSQASWMSGGSWGSSVSRCSAGTLGGKGLCPLTEPVLPSWARASLSYPSYPSLCRGTGGSGGRRWPQALPATLLAHCTGLQGVRFQGPL